MRDSSGRPVYLNLLQIRLPVTGVVSILHRVTGVLLVVAIPFLLYALQQALASPDRFETWRARAASPAGKVAGLLLAWFFAQHLFSGIRHLLLDIDIGIGLAAARRGAWLVFVAAALSVVAAGAMT